MIPLKNPSLSDIIEACNEVGLLRHKYKGMAAAFAAMNLNAHQCFSCGQKGHFINSPQINLTKLSSLEFVPAVKRGVATQTSTGPDLTEMESLCREMGNGGQKGAAQ